MTLNEVEELLIVARGMRQAEGRLPGVVDWSVPVDHPKRVKAIASGEEFYRWTKSGKNYMIGETYIIITLRDGAVAEKFYWEPSL